MQLQCDVMCSVSPVFAVQWEGDHVEAPPRPVSPRQWCMDECLGVVTGAQAHVRTCVPYLFQQDAS